MNPLVSIVTVSFNQGRFIEQTIRSVLAQTYPHIEYLILDAGSTDESVEVIRKYQDRLAYWHSRPDKGSCYGLREGFERSSGQILAWINSDDLLAPDAVERAVNALNKHPESVMVYGNRVCIGEQGQFLYLKPSLPWLARSMYIATTIGQETCFWRRESYFKVGGLDTRWRFSLDYDLFSKLTLSGPVIYDGTIWGFFRKHASSKTMTQYRTIGRKENAEIQAEVWGKVANPFVWFLVQLLCRCYAVCSPIWIRKPMWPEALPQQQSQNMLQRYYGSLHENSLPKRIMRKLKPSA